MATLVCKTCKNEFFTYRLKRQYCTHLCAMKAPWNTLKKKGDANVSKRKDVRQKMSESAKKIIMSARYNWKGNKVSYAGVHIWVKLHWGKPSECEHCGEDGKKHRIEWANISGQYSREDRSDWLTLCTPCHARFDFSKLTETQKEKRRENMKYAQKFRWNKN